MATTLSSLPGTFSEMRTLFLEPLRAGCRHATTIRRCPAESDWGWPTKGVDRVLSNLCSARDLLQTFQTFWSREVQVGPCFEGPASQRRLRMVAECSGLLLRLVDALRLSPLSQFASLASFDRLRKPSSSTRRGFDAFPVTRARRTRSGICLWSGRMAALKPRRSRMVDTPVSSRGRALRGPFACPA